MRRRLLNLLTAGSLLLCVAAAALWAWGGILYFGHRPQWYVTAERGRIDVAPSDGSDHPLSVDMPAAAAILFCLVLPALAIQRRQRLKGVRTRLWLLPVFYGLAAMQVWSHGAHWDPLLSWFLWIPLAALVWMAARQLLLERRRQNALHGLCSRCGYDLRATPETCPECGAAVADSG